MKLVDIIYILVCLTAYLLIVKFLWCDRDPGVCGGCGFFSSCEDKDTQCIGLFPIIPGVIQPFSKCLSVNNNDNEEAPPDDEETEDTEETKDTEETEDQKTDDEAKYAEYAATTDDETFMREFCFWRKFKHRVHKTTMDELLDNAEKQDTHELLQPRFY